MNDTTSLINQLLSMASSQAKSTVSGQAQAREQVVQLLQMQNKPVLRSEAISLQAALLAAPKGGQAKLSTKLGEILVKWPPNLPPNGSFVVRFKPELGAERVTIQPVPGAGDEAARSNNGGQGKGQSLSTQDQTSLRNIPETQMAKLPTISASTRAESPTPTPQVPSSLIQHGGLYKGQTLHLVPFHSSPLGTAGQASLGQYGLTQNAQISSVKFLQQNANGGDLKTQSLPISTGQRVLSTPAPLSGMQFAGRSAQLYGRAELQLPTMANTVAGQTGGVTNLTLGSTIYGRSAGSLNSAYTQPQRGYTPMRNTMVQIHDVRPFGLATMTAGAREGAQTLSIPEYGLGRVADLAVAGRTVGTVIGFTDQDLPILALMRSGLGGQPMRYAVLPSRDPNVTVGSLVSFSVADKMPSHSFKPFSAMSDTAWPYLEEALEAQAAQGARLINPLSNLSTILPQAQNPAQMVSSTLFLLAALTGGNVGTWLNSSIANSLRQAGGGRLLDALQDDFSNLSRLISEPSGQDWRMLSIPLMDQSVLTKANIFTREFYEEDGDTGERSKVMRFVVDLDMSRMGDVQIDGLIRMERLDMILRTEKEIGEVARQALRQRYTSLISETGYEGDLSFQSDPKKLLVFQ